MIELNVNIDHVATIRNARGGKEPDPVTAALKAELAGANGIVCHLREDRRHINDRDLRLIKETISVKLDLEMAANEEIIKIALETKPTMVTIVPEKRQELTTEGGLNVVADIAKYKDLVSIFHDKDIFVSFFIEPEREQIEATLTTNADMVEFHTGVYANCKTKKELKDEIKRLSTAIDFAQKNALKIAAGHGLNYQNTYAIAQLPNINELSIGHSIISRAIFVGIEQAVKDMLKIIREAELISNIQNLRKEVKH